MKITERQVVLEKALRAKKYGVRSMLAALASVVWVVAAVVVMSLGGAENGSIFFMVLAVISGIYSTVFYIMSIVQSFKAAGVLLDSGELGGSIRVAGWIGVVSLFLGWIPYLGLSTIVYLIMIFTNVNKVRRELDLLAKKDD